MKFMLLMLPTVPGTLEDRKRLRPIGRNNERYQQMLDELRKLVVFADEVGFETSSPRRSTTSIRKATRHRSRRSSSTPTSPPAPSASSSRRWGWYCRRGIRSALPRNWPCSTT